MFRMHACFFDCPCVHHKQTSSSASPKIDATTGFLAVLGRCRPYLVPVLPICIFPKLLIAWENWYAPLLSVGQLPAAERVGHVQFVWRVFFFFNQDKNSKYRSLTPAAVHAGVDALSWTTSTLAHPSGVDATGTMSTNADNEDCAVDGIMSDDGRCGRVCGCGCGWMHMHTRGCACARACARSCACVGDLCVCTVPIVQGSEREGQTNNWCLQAVCPVLYIVWLKTTPPRKGDTMAS